MDYIKDPLTEPFGRSKQTWSGTHRGIAWEIQNFEMWDGFDHRVKQCWTFYLYLTIDAIPDDPESFWLKPEKLYKHRIDYNYMDHPVLNSIEWHGGITWYSKEQGFEGDRRVIKVGCDYMHLHDEPDLETIKGVYLDACKAIDSFRLLVPGYKYHCWWDGHLHDPSEVTVDGGEYTCGCRAKAQEAK